MTISQTFILSILISIFASGFGLGMFFLPEHITPASVLITLIGGLAGFFTLVISIRRIGDFETLEGVASTLYTYTAAMGSWAIFWGCYSASLIQSLEPSPFKFAIIHFLMASVILSVLTTLHYKFTKKDKT